MKKEKTPTKTIRNTFLLSLLLIVINTINGQTPNDSLNAVGSIDRIINEAITLIHLPEPTFKPYQSREMDSNALADIGFEQTYENVKLTYVMRDGKNLFAYKYPSKSKNTIILLHGALSTAYLYNKTAGLLQNATNSEIIALDARGHGQSEGAIGDVTYIDQYIDDLADLIETVKKDKPKGKVIIAGHSMGGGIALKYAIRKDVPEVDGYLLFAPLLGKNSPTIRKDSNYEGQEEAFIKVHIPRLVGLKILNIVQNHEHDSLPVLYFNLPKEIPFQKYSYRANESMTPNDYKKGLKSVNKPLLVLVGGKDEAFISLEFEPAISEYSNGKTIVLEGLSHSGIRHSEKAMQEIKVWFKKHY
jgi:non-heme chloroperoxidase